MRVSLQTIHLLKNLGDVDACRAYWSWLKFADFNDPPVCVSAYWHSDDYFSVGLIWDERLEKAS